MGNSTDVLSVQDFHELLHNKYGLDVDSRLPFSTVESLARDLFVLEGVTAPLPHDELLALFLTLDVDNSGTISARDFEGALVLLREELGGRGAVRAARTMPEVSTRSSKPKITMPKSGASMDHPSNRPDKSATSKLSGSRGDPRPDTTQQVLHSHAPVHPAHAPVQHVHAPVQNSLRSQTVRHVVKEEAVQTVREESVQTVEVEHSYVDVPDEEVLSQIYAAQAMEPATYGWKGKAARQASMQLQQEVRYYGQEEYDFAEGDYEHDLSSTQLGVASNRPVQPAVDDAELTGLRNGLPLHGPLVSITLAGGMSCVETDGGSMCLHSGAEAPSMEWPPPRVDLPRVRGEIAVEHVESLPAFTLDPRKPWAPQLMGYHKRLDAAASSRPSSASMEPSSPRQQSWRSVRAAADSRGNRGSQSGHSQRGSRVEGLAKPVADSPNESVSASNNVWHVTDSIMNAIMPPSEEDDEQDAAAEPEVAEVASEARSAEPEPLQKNSVKDRWALRQKRAAQNNFLAKVSKGHIEQSSSADTLSEDSENTE
mmetsp:Transcript_64103/g.119186  ORF Transcript_64103/g.119186 Transcript_64103/m.119186 type:complete len:539 (-) Transcript_64103:49-1665(-)